MRYKCFIIDDEPIAGDILENYLGQLEEFEVAGKFTNPVKAFAALQTTPGIDLIFLDIQMPGLTGLELMQSLRRRPEIILTTAYREFALEGFEEDVTDYLLKPIALDRFLKAIAKFHARIRKAEAKPFVLPASGKEGAESSPHIFVRADRKDVRVLLNEVLYLESLKDYVSIITTRGRIVTKETISHFEQMLPAEEFLRVHRSFIVALRKITARSGDGLEIGAALIPVGRQYKLGVEKALKG